jgi:hypothetical protein
VILTAGIAGKRGESYKITSSLAISSNNTPTGSKRYIRFDWNGVNWI